MTGLRVPRDLVKAVMIIRLHDSVMKLSRPIVIPCILLVYLAVMAYMGLDGLRTGQTSLFQYIATIVVTLGVIILLHFFLRKRERLHKERKNDIEKLNK